MGAVLQAFLLFLLPAHFLYAILITLLLVVCISYGFELTSKITGRGHYDVMDAVASVLGGLIGMGLQLWLKADLLVGFSL